MTQEKTIHSSVDHRRLANLGCPALIFITCLAVYFLFLSGHHYSIDGVVMFEYAKVLLFKGSFFFNPPLMWGNPFETSKWPIGLTLVYMPVLAMLAATAFRGDPQIYTVPNDLSSAYPPGLLANRPYLYSSWVNPVVTALTAVLVYSLGLSLGLTKRQACAAALIFGLFSPAAAYARFDYAQPLASLLLLAAVLFFLHAWFSLSTGKLLWSGVFLGLAVLTRPEFLIVPGIVMLALSFFLGAPIKRSPWWAAPGLFMLPVGLFFLANQIMNSVRFGSLFKLGYTPGSDFSLNPLRYGVAFFGNLISPGRGIFLFFPLSLVAILGLVLVFKRERWSGWLLGSVTCGLVIFYSTWYHWDAGISWGPRFLIPALPYLTVLAVVALKDMAGQFGRKSFAVFVLLFLLGGIASFQGVLFNFLEFYSSFQLSIPQAYSGTYNFYPALSPIFSGWTYLFDPAHYDIVWLQSGGNQAHIRIFVALLLLAAGLASVWAALFSRKIKRLHF